MDFVRDGGIRVRPDAGGRLYAGELCLSPSNSMLRLSEERFRVALKGAPVVVFTEDPQLRYTWISSPVLAWNRQDYVGKTDAEILGDQEAARLTAIKQEVLRTPFDAGLITAGCLHMPDWKPPA